MLNMTLDDKLNHLKGFINSFQKKIISSGGQTLQKVQLSKSMDKMQLMTPSHLLTECQM